MTQQITKTQVVKIDQGQLKGTFGKNLDGNEFLQFLGIPYGKPPVGDLRFKPPQPADPWEGIRDATKVGSGSISKSEMTGEVEGLEDCLYLNVYTRNLPSSQTGLRPVMVWIHGGGLTMGSSNPSIYGPEFLMTKDIVLVSFNYRLGLLGFLAFDDKALGVFGNMGLKDQNLALKWVQKNIAQFNGDPKNVTIFGESAGAGSVHAHVLSPASKGLFHKAIIQSGCSLNAWFWGSKNIGKKIVQKIGKSAFSEKEALNILEKLSGKDVFTAQEKLGDILLPANRRNFAAVIETPNETAFFDKSPIEILKEGSFNKVPIIFGYTDTEGILLDQAKIWMANDGITSINIEIEDLIPHVLNVEKGSDDSKKIGAALEKLYLNSTTINRDFYDEYTDSYFLVGIIETIRHQLKTSNEPIYLYRMSLVAQLNFLKIILRHFDKPGTAHGDDLGYLFHSVLLPEIKPGSLEDKSVRTFVELWTNFAEYGNPTPDHKLNVFWKPVDSEDNIKLLDIGEKLVYKAIPERNRLDVWQDILKTWPIARLN